MSDPRFSRLRTDPRFKRPRKDQNKIVVDERFKSIFQDDDAAGKKGKGKNKQPRIDKYGRPISRTKDREDLRKFYRMEDDDDNDAEPEAGPSTNRKGPRRHVDLARGEVLLESSSEEDSDEDDGGVVSLGPETYKLAPSATKKRHIHADDDLEIDLDESQFAELDAEAAEAAKDDDDDQRRTTAKGDETARLAVVNLDWDHVRASDLFRVFSSTAALIDEGGGGGDDGEATTKPRKRNRPSKETPTTTTTTRVLRVRIYPSEFGKSRMEKEDLEGPPPEIFADKKKKNAMMPTILLSRRQRENIAAKEEELLGMNPDDVNEKTIYHQEDADQFDQEALRKYQLERLRYFYAVVECDSPQTAAFIYAELDGSELERTANLFDLSYIPADMTFEEEFRDEATQDLGNHKPLAFATDALRSSKVKLTWDDDDQDRIELTRRPLTQKEIDENDFGKYLAASSDEESEPEATADQAPNSKAAKRAADRARLRGLLLGEGGVGKNDDDFFTYDDGKNRAGDMEITFTPGLSMSAKKEEEEETTLDLYKKKMKEKKQARMSKWEEKKDVWRKRQSGEAASEDEEAGAGHHGDTFFEARDEADEEEAALPPPRKKPSTAAELALLAADLEPADGAQHFDMAKVLKAEKKSTKKKKIRKHRGKGEDENVDQEDEREDGRGFEIDVQDDRFKALHDEYEFAIDPSNPHYKKTKAMNQLLDERRKRLKDKVKGEVEQRNARKQAKEAEADGPDLNKLVQSVKRKSESAAKTTSEHRGKRSKLG